MVARAGTPLRTAGTRRFTRKYLNVIAMAMQILIFSRYSQIDFWRRCTFPKWSDWNIVYTRKGIWNMRRRRATRVLAAVLAIVGAYRFRQSGLGVKDFKGMLQKVVQDSLASLVELRTVLQKQVGV